MPVGGRDKLVGSIEGLIKSVQQSLDKVHARLETNDRYPPLRPLRLSQVNARLETERQSRDALQATYDKLVEKERKYYKLVREFQTEALRNEQLGAASG